MVAFSVQPDLLYAYAKDFRSAGDKWQSVYQTLMDCNLPADAFGSGGGVLGILSSLPGASYVPNTSTFELPQWNITGAAAQPDLYNTYHTTWQDCTNLAKDAPATMNKWANTLDDTAGRYEQSDQKEATQFVGIPGNVR